MQPALKSQDSTIFLYDGSFEGLLTAIFESYDRKIVPINIVAEEDHQESLFDTAEVIETDPRKSNRVYAGLRSRTSPGGARRLYRCFLSEQPGIELLIFDFARKCFASEINIEENYADDTVRTLHEINNKIGREVHRMHAFVRFQRTADDIFFSVIEPDFNVIPLIGDHFEKRYADQRWIIYDTSRHYGIHYDLHKVEYVTFAEANHLQFRQLSADILQSEELDYQKLWKSYFDAVNIPERRNMKLHLQHVPKRYWKYLSEK